MDTRTKQILIYLLGAGIIALGVFWYSEKIEKNRSAIPSPVSKEKLSASSPTQTTPPLPELPEEMKTLATLTDKKEQAKLVRTMAEKYGTLETLAFMRQSGLPFTGETHLLVHEIGNVAYEKYGKKALLYCDESFLSACYHGVILNALADSGLEGVTEYIDACKAAGERVVAQCSHAAGHGFLAWQDYKVLEALPYCDRLAEMDSAIPTYNCYDGVFMENIFGVHDGKPSPNRMIKAGEPYYPCNAVPGKYQGGCYANQATVMFEVFKGDLKRVAESCDAITTKELEKICFNNFARQIHPMTLGKTETAVKLCQNAPDLYWQDDCMISLVSAAFSVGDTKEMPYAQCRAIAGHPRENECYQALWQHIESYGKDRTERLAWCGNVKDASRQKECRTRFDSSHE